MSLFFPKFKSAFSHSPESNSGNQSSQEQSEPSIQVQSTIHEEWIENYFAGDYGLASGAMEMFLEETVPEFNKLDNILAKEGVQSLHKQLHRIKPSFKVVGLDEIAEALGNLERDTLKSIDVDAIQKRVKQLTAEFNRFLPLVKQQYSNISKLAGE